LALGIDAEAHRGALEGKTPTWAVLGSGLASIYPSSHKQLSQKIIENGGAIISEYPPTYPPAKWTFPQRNRIIAGLTQATVVVEAPKRSGALITAYFSLEYNREVGAVPGEIDSINSEGANKLIKSGACLIRNSDDILELLGMEQKSKTSSFDNLEEIDILIINSLSEPKNVDELLEITKLPISELNQRITLLELQGLIKNQNGLLQKIK
ncbi:MAG: DNA-processing protein DprA, partial [Candidatus Paceibacteria bacterium]